VIDSVTRRIHFWRSLGDHEVVVFDSKTSATHVLDEDSACLLECLQEESADFQRLVSQLHLIYPDSSSQELEEFVTGALEEFAALGLHDLMGQST